MRNALPETLKGAAAGLAATVPMTVAMEYLHRRLPASERQPLPPRQITENAARRVNLDDELGGERDRQKAALAAHFGFGAAMGGIYSLVAPHVPMHPVARGVAFGLLVYAANYLGVMPATGLTPHAPHDSPRRVGLMVAAHVIYGAALGVLVGDKVSNRERR